MKKLFIALMFCPVVAIAAAIPQKSSFDSRIQYIKYNVDNVTHIKAFIGNVTTIKFEDDEQAKHYGSGYGNAWEFQARDNFFFLKPTDFQADTNISIITNKNRIYQIDVSLVNNPDQATYLLSYKYPDSEKSISDAQKISNNNKLALKQDIKRNVQFNFDYTMNFGKDKSSKWLAPELMYDDGRFTYIRFADAIELPAIFAITGSGESVINSHIENNEIVIHSINREYRFRQGNAVVGVYNNNYENSLKIKLDKSSGTNLPDVKREVVFDD